MLSGTNYPSTPSYNDGGSSHYRPDQRPGAYNGQQTQRRGSVILPPGKNDLEILENLKKIILDGQHEFYRAIPQPEALARLYLGKIPTTEPVKGIPASAPASETPVKVNSMPGSATSGALSPVDTPGRPPRMKNKEIARVPSVNGAPENVVHAMDNSNSNGVMTPPTSSPGNATNNAMDTSTDDKPIAPVSPVKPGPDIPPNPAGIDSPSGRIPPSHLPEKPSLDPRPAPPTGGWQANPRPESYERPPVNSSPTRGDRSGPHPPRDDRFYEIDQRDRDFRDRNRRPYDRFGTTSMRRPPPEERHYEPPPDHVLPPRRYDYIKAEEVPISLSDLETRHHDARPTVPADHQDLRPAYARLQDLPRSYAPANDDRPADDSRGPVRTGDDAVAGVQQPLPAGAPGDDRDFHVPPPDASFSRGPPPLQDAPPKVVDDGRRDDQRGPVHRSGSIPDPPVRQADRYVPRPPSPTSKAPGLRDDPRGLPAKVPPSPSINRAPPPQDYRGRPTEYRPPVPNNYRPDYGDRRPDRMDIDESRGYVDTARSYRPPYSSPPPPESSRDRNRPPSPSRPVSDPHYDDRRFTGAPPSSGSGTRDWYSGQSGQSYTPGRRWEDEEYYKGRPAQWEPPLDRERYDPRDPTPRPGARGWESSDRDPRGYNRAGPPNAPPPDDRYAAPPPSRVPPSSGPAPPYSRVRPRSPSPLRRQSGSIDDARPPYKRPRDDYAAPPAADYYPPGPTRRGPEYNPHAPLNHSPGGPPPSSAGSAYYPPPSTGSSGVSDRGDRDYMRRDSGADISSYPPPPPHGGQSYRPRSPGPSGRAPPPSSSGYDNRGPPGGYARPPPGRDRGSYMPPPPRP